MNKLFGLSLLALAFASCQNSGNSKPMNPAPTTAPTTFSTTPSVTLDSSKPGTITNTPAAVAAPATTTTSTATAGMNPEHGAPGHRCDIPVGSPLNTPAGSTAMPAPTNNPAPVIMKPATLPQPANSNVRLNPAHGAPGHDCAIPVGQPLKS